MIESGLKSFRLPQELLQRLEVRAKEDKTSSSKIIVQAVAQFLDGPNGPKNYSVISPELIEWGHQLQEDILKDMRGLLFPQRQSFGTPKLTLYKAEEILVETTPGTLGSVDAFTVVQEEVPIEVIKEKVKVPRGTCSECFSKGGQHQKFCSKRKK